MPRLRQGGVYAFRIVPAGYEFLGPGNEVRYQVPRNHNDAIAKAHDIAYGRLQDKGLNPYFSFSQADADFLRDIKPDDLASMFAQYAFEGKRWLAEHNFIATLPGTSQSNSPW